MLIPIISETTKLQFHFYGDLKHFLSPQRRGKSFSYRVKGEPSIKDTIEALGVPHTEVDAILINGKSVNFRYQLKGKHSVSVYPDSNRTRVSVIKKLKPKVPLHPKFVLDVHLGKLCHYLRLLGFDTLYHCAYSDRQLVHISERENRYVLTRDIGLLKNKRIKYGYFVRNTNSEKQVREAARRFRLQKTITPFKRCIACNGSLRKIAKKRIAGQLPLKVRAYYQEFKCCSSCGKIYWKGTHYEHLKKMIRYIFNNVLTL